MDLRAGSAATNEDDASEAALAAAMRAYQDGSLAAFERLHASLEPRLRGFLARHAGAHAAADLVQEAFLEMHRARRTYEPGRPVMPWAFGIARNVLLRHRDAERRHGRAGATPDIADPAMPPDVDVGDVGKALDGLSPATRDAWLLHHVGGHGFDEIGRRLGIATTAARLRSSRANALLRRALGLNGSDSDD
jgi:RNA polymerase sigma-70 factor (ECF subfamily)